MMLRKDSKEFVELLNLKKVDYLILGACAAALHCHLLLTAES
jgi:hypothetical protein